MHFDREQMNKHHFPRLDSVMKRSEFTIPPLNILRADGKLSSTLMIELLKTAVKIYPIRVFIN